MTLDLGPIKERAERATAYPHVLAHVSAQDVPALVAEVEALRAALGAEREHCDEWRALFGEVRGSSPMKFVKYHEDKDYYVAAVLCENHDARRALDAGGKP